MSPTLAALVKHLVEAEAGDPSSSATVAAATVSTCVKITAHFSRLVGHTGIRTLLDRSLALTRKHFAWIAIVGPQTDDTRWAAVHASLVEMDADSALAAFTMFVETFVELFVRLIGDPLVARLLSEIWPKSKSAH